MEKIKAVVFIGAPGSGKGTIAELIEEKFEDHVHFSTGDYIREKLKDFTGNYLDDDIIFGFVKEKLIEFIGKKVILDGLPRTVSQYEKINEIFEVENYFLFGGVCQAELENRLNERKRKGENFSKRINDYNELTLPLFNLILNSETEKRVLIDCSQQIDDVLVSVCQKL